jgi:hypothetical protein
VVGRRIKEDREDERERIGVGEVTGGYWRFDESPVLVLRTSVGL